MKPQASTIPFTASLDVAVVIVSWNVCAYLDKCLHSLLDAFAYDQLNGLVWVVDNQSADQSVEHVRQNFPMVQLIANTENRGFGAANNQGIAAAMQHHPRHILLLNPDTEVHSGTIGRMIKWLDTELQVGMVGCKLLNSDGTLQHSAFRFPGISQLLFEFYRWPARFYNTILNGRYPTEWYAQYTPFKIDYPLGAAMLVRYDVVCATGGFDEAFHLYCEEIDWAWRIKQAGWQINMIPAATITHHGGASTGQAKPQSIIDLWQSRAKLYKKSMHPVRYFVAKKIVQRGLDNLAKQTDSAALQSAYHTAAMLWK